MEKSCKDECDTTKKEMCHEKKSSECHDFFLEVANDAWIEVLKDKIKEHILSTQGGKITELAKIISESNSKRWKNKMESKKNCAEFKEEICRFLSQKD